MPYQVGDIFVSLTHQPSRVTLLNNIYSVNRARGQLITTPNTFAQNNTYDRTTAMGVLVFFSSSSFFCLYSYFIGEQIFPDDYYWYKSNAVNNVTIRDSVFNYTSYSIGASAGDIQVVFYLYSIFIANC